MSNPVSFGATVPDEVLFNNKNKWLKPDDEGNLPIHLADLDKTKEIHRALENQPEILAQMHTTKNKNGDLPIGYADLDKVKEIHRALENHPEILTQIHTTKNKDGDIPIHLADLDKTKEIHLILENQPEILAKMHTTKNKDGNLPIHYAGYSLNKIKEIHRALETQPKILARIHTTKNRCGNLPIDCEGSYKIKKILQVIERLAYNTPEISVKDSIKLLDMYKGYGKEFDEKAQNALEYLETQSQ